jgi:hypothetical protein
MLEVGSRGSMFSSANADLRSVLGFDASYEAPVALSRKENS